jgi:hypothetical protein
LEKRGYSTQLPNFHVVGACHKNCVNDHKEVKYGHGTKEGKERKGYY